MLSHMWVTETVDMVVRQLVYEAVASILGQLCAEILGLL